MRDGDHDDDDHDAPRVDNDDSSGGNDIYKHDYYCTLYDHDGPCVNHIDRSRNEYVIDTTKQYQQHNDDCSPGCFYDHATDNDTRVVVDESEYVLVRRSDLDNLNHAVRGEHYDGPADQFDALHDAARTLVDPATDRPADNDDAMRAYILERARYDAGIADHADIFGPLRDAARSFLAAAGDPVEP